LGSKILAPALLALLIGGCPKRQTTPRIVYVQQPPAATPAGANAATSAEALTIQEPSAASTEESLAVPVAAKPVPPPVQDNRKTRPPRVTSHDVADKPPEVPQPAVTGSPLQLQPQGGDVQETVISKRLEEITGELNDLEHDGNLSEDQQRAINDATAFRNQSSAALRQHDLLRAKQLADKAGLLIKAVLGHP
jgi:hypothetical protein